MGKYIISNDGIRLNSDPQFNTLASTVIEDKKEADEAENLNPDALQETTEKKDVAAEQITEAPQQTAEQNNDPEKAVAQNDQTAKSE